ncbi:unnamed protein product [Echinostoma caproni]|uniref:Uncharacterized protein n=1 Tax=Echinostoma caproni TaxID=27848 RepID=A0A183AWB8_9TREM|nr:unnamed protein product [Echinostoma caproni]
MGYTVAPWELEFQRHLTEGNRQRKLTRRICRSQSAHSSNKEFLYHLIAAELDSYSPESEPHDSNDESSQWTRTHRYSDVIDIEFWNQDSTESVSCEWMKTQMDNNRRQSVGDSYSTVAAPQALQYNFTDIAKKVVDNENMEIDTFSYLKNKREVDNAETDSGSLATIPSDEDSLNKEWPDEKPKTQSKEGIAGSGDEENFEEIENIQVSLDFPFTIRRARKCFLYK